MSQTLQVSASLEVLDYLAHRSSNAAIGAGSKAIHTISSSCNNAGTQITDVVITELYDSCLTPQLSAALEYLFADLTNLEVSVIVDTNPGSEFVGLSKALRLSAPLRKLCIRLDLEPKPSVTEEAKNRLFFVSG